MTSMHDDMSVQMTSFMDGNDFQPGSFIHSSLTYPYVSKINLYKRSAEHDQCTGKANESGLLKHLYLSEMYKAHRDSFVLSTNNELKLILICFKTFNLLGRVGKCVQLLKLVEDAGTVFDWLQEPQDLNYFLLISAENNQMWKGRRVVYIMQKLRTVLAFWFNSMAVLISAGTHTGTVVKSHTMTSALYVLMLRLKPNITILANIVSGKSTEWWGM